MSMGLFSSSAMNSVQLTRIERKLDLVLQHLGVQMPDDELEEVRSLMAAGQKIEAIKAYRRITGAGLAEAKNAVERGV
jgi:ribosomal protein L7/L12